MKHPRVGFGVDRVVNFPGILPRASRVALLTNDAARLARDPRVLSRVALLDAGVPIVRLFSPEHGIAASARDGSSVRDTNDRETGLPIMSLYGDRFDPPVELLRDLDYLLVDLPDVGARFYTYIWTLSHVLEACAKTQTRVIVLDRPNPIGGNLEHAEGPLLDEGECASFIGRWSIPVRHSLTIGELAYHWSKTRVKGVEIDVIRTHGWTRGDLWPSLGIPWMPMSPAMSSFESALLYPGTCLFEATNVSVGRGTSTPFQVIGAPWLNTRQVVDSLEGVAWLGVRLERGHFVPSTGPYAGEACQAVVFKVLDARRVRPVQLGIALLAAVMRSARGHFAWSTYPTAANPSGERHFERLVGRKYLRPKLADVDERVSLEEIARWTSPRTWHDDVRAALIYE